MLWILLFAVLGIWLLSMTAWLLKWQPTGDWQVFYKKWSTWLAGLNAAAWAHITATSGSLLGFIYFIPKIYQIPAAALVFLIGWIIPVITVHIRQQKLNGAPAVSSEPITQQNGVTISAGTDQSSSQ